MLPKFTARAKLLFKKVGPGAVGAGATQINLLISTILASTLPTGAVSYLFYADRLNQLPLGIVGIAVATILLPVLSKHVANGNEAKVRHYMSRSIEFCLVMGLPATIGLAFAAKPIIQTLFEHGVFGHDDTIETAKALMAYSLCVPGFLLVKVFSASFFARQNTTTPVKIAIIAMLVNVAAAIILLGPMKHVGIALSTSIATWVNTVLLYRLIRKNQGSIGDSKLTARVPKIIICALGMCIVTMLTVNATSGWFTAGNIWCKLTGLTIIIGLSGMSYAALLQLTGAMRWREALNIIKREE